MHAPERLKSHWTALRTHAVAVVPSRLFPAQFLQIFRMLAQILNAQQMTCTAHQTCRRKIVFPAVVFRIQCTSVLGRNMVRPE
jgi:hypothetical protein